MLHIIVPHRQKPLKLVRFPCSATSDFDLLILYNHSIPYHFTAVTFPCILCSMMCYVVIKMFYCELLLCYFIIKVPLQVSIRAYCYKTTTSMISVLFHSVTFSSCTFRTYYLIKMSSTLCFL